MSTLIKVAVACCLASVCAKQELFAGDQVVNQGLQTYFEITKGKEGLKIENIKKLVRTIDKMKERGPIQIVLCDKGNDKFIKNECFNNCIFIDESYSKWRVEHFNMDPHFCYIQSEAEEFINYVLHSEEAQDLRESLRHSVNFIWDDWGGLPEGTIQSTVDCFYAASTSNNPFKEMEENDISDVQNIKQGKDQLRESNKSKVSDICTFLNETLIRGGALFISADTYLNFKELGFGDFFDRNKIEMNIMHGVNYNENNKCSGWGLRNYMGEHPTTWHADEKVRNSWVPLPEAIKTGRIWGEPLTEKMKEDFKTCLTPGEVKQVHMSGNGFMGPGERGIPRRMLRITFNRE